MVKRCVWGTCNSDSRYADRFCGQFNPFPKPKTRLDACRRWIKACGRRHLDINKVNKHTYVCSKHFENGVGPTGEHPDPVAADGADPVLRRSPKRKTPVQAIRMDGTSIILHDAELEPCLKQGVNKLYKDQVLCDVTLTSNDGVDLQAHWLVLAAHSGFLQHVAVNQSMKHSMMSDSGKLKLDIESKVLKLMVDYLYCGELVVTKDCLDKVKQALKVLQLSRAADLLQQACLSETSQLTNTKEQPHVPTQRTLLPKPQPLVPKQRPQVPKKFAIDSTLLQPAGSPLSSPHQFKPIILSVESLKGSPTTALANPLSKSTNLHIPHMQGRSSLLDWSHGQSHGSTGNGGHLPGVPVDKSPGEECSLRTVKNKGCSTFSKHPCVSPEDNDECKTAPSSGGKTVQSWRKGLSKLVVGSTISNKSNNHPGMVSSGSFSPTGDQSNMNLDLVKTEHSYAESDDLDYTIYENMDTSDTDSCQGSLVSEGDAFPDQDMSSSAQSISSSPQSTSSSAQSISSSPRCRSSSAQGPSSSTQHTSSSVQDISSSVQGPSSSTQHTSSSVQDISSSVQGPSSSAQSTSSSAQSTSSSAQSTSSSAQSTSSSAQSTSSSPHGTSSSAQCISSSVQGPSSSAQSTSSSAQHMPSSAQGTSASAQSTSSSAQGTSSSAQRTSSSSSAHNDQTKAKRSVNAEECLYVGNPLTSKLQSHPTQESKPYHKSSGAFTRKYLHSQNAHEQDKTDTASNFPCKLCEETFKNLSDLKYHCLSKHLSTAMKRPKLNIHVKSSREPTASPKQCSDGRNRSSACSRRDELQTEVYPDQKEECFGQEEECPIQEEECPIQEECCGLEEDNHNHEEICPGQQKEFSGLEEEECRREGRISKTVDQADDNSQGSQAGQTPADSSSTQLPITSNRNGKRPRLTSDATIQEGIHISCLNKPRHPSTNCGQAQPTPDLKKPGKKKKKVEGTIHDYIAGGYYIEGGAVL
ncbi:uncharacterized protein LOC124116783 isoform X2 [Haliotis rufescens]|uniref:uncharacterized protein LOC124116783 isoform X2 n=1 Tax=Haliotis rufescens TaxID=6454 RepID=UPI00201EC767|nr:uncharacterized protein LOC124116783 isoform X2 [Haliotis rufescens]